LVLNWGTFWSYLRHKTFAGIYRWKELALAGVVAAIVVAGTTCNFLPFTLPMAWNMRIKDYWEERAVRAPVAHSEELPLAEFAKQINLPLDAVTKALAEEGFGVPNSDTTVRQIAAAKGVAPSEVLAAIQKHHPGVSSTTGAGEGGGKAEHGPGMGRGMGKGMGRGMGKSKTWE
jgi:hypothetical protein